MADQTVNVYIVGHNRVSSASDAAGRSLSTLGTKMQAVGRSMTVGITLPVVAGFALAVREAQEAVKATAQTEAVIRSTGGAANVTKKEVEGLAEALSKKTAIDDEVIQSGENMLLTFTKIRNEAGEGNDIFNQATVAITDMSVALGQDMKTSAIQLGKALNDPIAGVTALRRVGVQLTDQQEEQIRKFVEAGDVLSAQKVILSEVMTEFGGSAEKAATPFDKMVVKMKDLAEKVGMRLIPVLTRLSEVVIKIADAFLSMPSWAQEFALGALAVSAAVGPMLQFGAAIIRVAGVVPGVAGGLARLLPLLAAHPILAGVAAAGFVALAASMHSGKNIAEQSESTYRRMDSVTKLLSDSTRRATADERAANETRRASKQAIEDQTRALNGWRDAQTAGANASIRIEQAQVAYNQAIQDYGIGSLEARQAEVDWKGSIDQKVVSMQRAGESTQSQIDTLNFLAGTVAPGSPLQAYLATYVARLQSSEGIRQAQLLLDTAQANAALDALEARINTPKIMTIIANTDFVQDLINGGPGART